MKNKKKISTITPTFSSLEKQNTTTTTINNNNNNNNHNNDRNNTSNIKKNNNTLMTIALPKTNLSILRSKKKKRKFPKKHCQEKTKISIQESNTFAKTSRWKINKGIRV